MVEIERNNGRGSCVSPAMELSLLAPDAGVAASVIWNAFLALIPVGLAYLIPAVATSKVRSGVRYPFVALLILAWLAMVPNTCYLLTEWRKFLAIVDGQDLYVRSANDEMVFVRVCALWLAYFLYSGLGMVAFTLSIRPVERLIARRGGSIWVWGLPFFAALSVGVYLGLILRFNSWDLLTRPSTVWSVIAGLVGRPALSAFIVVFGVFLWVAYEAIDIWIDGILDRKNRLSATPVGQRSERGRAAGVSGHF